jgi:hypothetical protein
MEKLENDDFNFDFQQNNDFQHVSIQVMTNVAPISFPEPAILGKEREALG